MSDIKERLHHLCVTCIKNRMYAAEQAIAGAQQSANDDTKSSAGDKYETGREMAQQETNRNLAQLNEANKLMVALNKVNYKTTHPEADSGSLVVTDGGLFYLAVSAGTLALDGKNYFAVSPASPIGMKLKGKIAGEDFNLNGKTYRIEYVL